jgi:DNA/RNA endonuclease YhcR with UshA esterase domain
MNAKTLTLLLAVFLFTCGTIFAETISPEEAKDHVGKIVTVVGHVSELHVAARAYFLNMGGHNPNEAVSIVCFSSAGITPDELTKFEHKTISVTGKVKLYHGKTEIILTSLDQISEH